MTGNGLPIGNEPDTTVRVDRRMSAGLGSATLEAAFPPAHQGFSVEGDGRKLASPASWECRLQAPATCVAAGWSERDSEPGAEARATNTKLDRKNSPVLASSAASRLACSSAASWSA